ncbi:hypothetical protein DXG01_015172, partial [Tephrocybe rancida]
YGYQSLQKDFSNLYTWTKPKSHELPWAVPGKNRKLQVPENATLYGINYLSVTLDEAHAFRNIGAKHASALLILGKSVLRFILTATPLQTSTKDLSGMARLVNIPGFLTKEACDEERLDYNATRKSGEDGLDPLTLEAIARKLQGRFEGRLLRRTGDSLDWEGKKLIHIPPYEE